jgi:hypothetical protein
MRSRPLVAASVVVGAALLLTACDPGGESVTPTPSATVDAPAELVLPDDAVLGLVAIATAPNGATADVAIVVHATLPYLVPEAADAVAATVDWCAGEVDDAVITGRGYTFTAVDVRLTPRDGDWPDDVSLLVLPVVNPETGSTIAAGAGLRQVDEASDDVFGDAVPHCRQPALLDGAGEGTLYLGIPQDIAGVNDNEPFTAWTLHDFGLSSALPGDLGDAGVVFSSCTAAITELGGEFGAPGPTWSERFDESGCIVGGAGDAGS